MAGGKETPRQKMIGMMYLVLTALLALQVSNAVLEKFAIINVTLSSLITEGEKKSNQILQGIVADAGQSQDANVLAAKANAEKVRELTKNTIAAIDGLKKKMMTTAGTDKIDEKLINDHSSKVATMMIDVNSPEGKNYEKLLNDYVKQVNELAKPEPPFQKIAKAPKDIPIFAADEDHVRKDFLTFTFENTPVIAALASVTQAQTEVLDLEARALDKLAKDAGANRISFDQFIPMVRAKSSTVAAGAKYEAQMFLTGSSTALQSDFFKDGAKLPTVADASGVTMGKVEFTAQGGGYDAHGLAKKSFKAEIKVKGQTFTQNIEYFVAQPTIKVTTGNAPTLYMNCGNTVNIEVPTLGTDYNPSFNAAGGAEIIKGDKPGKVTIIPKQRKISIAVNNGGMNIGSQGFDVKNVPAPRYVAYLGNTPVDLRNGIKANQIANLRFSADPEANFKEEVPKDARYRIKRAEVILGRGTAGVQRMQANNENPDLRAWTNQARPGDRIVIDIKDVVRKTYQDEEEKVTVTGSSGIISIPIN
ncbi:gliding motility protein GldM [Chryseolinea sp. T2]|uniref:type IX secretion system motor protein PorM/GldM n=1 Tax=Chryseolinea sp. T2 TaxID=3129255 RepID=UPI003076B611